MVQYRQSLLHLHVLHLTVRHSCCAFHLTTFVKLLQIVPYLPRCLLIYFSSVADAEYQYYEFFVSLFIDDPVVPHVEPVIVFLRTGKFYYVVLQNGRILSKDEQLFFDYFLKWEINSLEILESFTEEFECVYVLQIPSSFQTSLVSTILPRPSLRSFILFCTSLRSRKSK